MNRAEPFLINNTLISKENFMKLEMWFENDPIYSDVASKKYNIRSYLFIAENETNVTLKEVIFDINKEDDV